MYPLDLWHLITSIQCWLSWEMCLFFPGVPGINISSIKREYKQLMSLINLITYHFRLWKFTPNICQITWWNSGHYKFYLKLRLSFQFVVYVISNIWWSLSRTVAGTDWCDPVGWASFCKLKGHWLYFRSGHIPGLWARPQVEGTRGN